MKKRLCELKKGDMFLMYGHTYQITRTEDSIRYRLYNFGADRVSGAESVYGTNCQMIVETIVDKINVLS